MLTNQKQEVVTKVENLPLDLNVNELQAQGGYVSTFLNEHMMIMGALTSLGNDANKITIVTMAIELKVSLIVDNKVRDELWTWYEEECKKNMNDEMSQQDKQNAKYRVAVILLGKIMSFVGRHLSTPVEIGTE